MTPVGTLLQSETIEWLGYSLFAWGQIDGLDLRNYNSRNIAIGTYCSWLVAQQLLSIEQSEYTLLSVRCVNQEQFELLQNIRL
jgi:hypothetical protein